MHVHTITIHTRDFVGDRFVPACCESLGCRVESLVKRRFVLILHTTSHDVNRFFSQFLVFRSLHVVCDVIIPVTSPLHFVVAFDSDYNLRLSVAVSHVSFEFCRWAKQDSKNSWQEWAPISPVTCDSSVYPPACNPCLPTCRCLLQQ